MDVKNIKFYPLKNIYVTLGFIFSFVAILVTTTFGYLNYKQSIDSKILELNNLVSGLKSHNSELEKEIENKNVRISKYKSIIFNDKSDLPKPLSFTINDSIIRVPIPNALSMIPFEWINKYFPENDLGLEKYKIIIADLDLNRKEIVEISSSKDTEVIGLSSKSIHYSWKISNSTNTKFSDEIKFSIYPSTLDRIKATNRIMVGTTPPIKNSVDPLHKSTFEGKLVLMLIEELKLILDMDNLRYIRKTFIWNDLLNAVKTGKVDIAIGGITVTNKREKVFKPLRFTIPYKQNHQMFVIKNNFSINKFPQGLENSNVAVPINTINMKAAKEVLSKKYNFKIFKVPSFKDAYTKLHIGDEVNISLIDSEYFNRFKKPFSLKQYGPLLDDDLKQFYINISGKDSEDYAIAVHEPTSNDRKNESLLMHLNDILTKHIK